MKKWLCLLWLCLAPALVWAQDEPPDIPGDASLPAQPLVGNPRAGANSLNWINTNPGAGGAWNLLMETPYAMFAGGDVGGLWRSGNRGATWNLRGQRNAGVKFNRTSVTAMDFDPRTDSLVFYAACEGRLLRSVDGGLTFHATVIDSGTATDAGDTPTDWIASVAVCKQQPDNVYAVWHSTFGDTSAFAVVGGWLTGNLTGGNGGTGYTVGDLLTLSGGTNGRAQIVTAPAGVVATFKMVDAGSAYTTGVKTTTGGTGTGCQINITAIQASAPAYSMVKKSIDRGITWTNQMTAGQFAVGTRMLKIMVDPSAPTICYLLTGGDRFADFRTNVSRYKLYVSTNSGAAWTDITPPTGSEGALDAMLHPSNSDTVFCTTWTGALNGAHSGHTWVSFNRGTAWQAALSAHTGSLALRGVLSGKAVNPGGAATVEPAIYVVDPTLDRGGSCTECGAWWSQFPWASWARTSDGLDWATGWVGINSNGGDGATSASSRGFCNTINTSADTAGFVWGTGQFVHRFTYADGALRSLGSDSLRAGPALGRSHWYRGRAIDNVVTMALTGAGQWLYQGSWDIGIWRSQDRGDSWQPSNDVAMTNQASGWYGMGGDCSTILADPSGNGHVWANQGTGKHKTNMTRSVKSGEPGSWAAVGGGVADSLVYGLSLDIHSPPGNRTLYCTTMGDVARSLDDGQTWALIIDHTTAHNLRGCDGACAPTGRDTSAFQVTAVDNSGTLWIGSASHLMKSTNPTATSPTFTEATGAGPISWAPVAGSGSNFDFRYRGIHDIVPTQSQGLFVVISGNGSTVGATAADSFGVYRTLSNGASWIKVHTGKYDDRFAVLPDGSWMVGSRSVGAGGGITLGQGLFLSRDRGATWADLSGAGQLPWPSFGPIFVDPQFGSYVMVGAPGQAFFRANLPTSGAFAP